MSPIHVAVSQIPHARESPVNNDSLQVGSSHPLVVIIVVDLYVDGSSACCHRVCLLRRRHGRGG